MRELSREDQELVAHAVTARAHAYAPYSQFPVGAAVRTEKGVFTGVNVENAAYPLGVCAERNAIAAAAGAGARKVEAVAVVADTPEPVSPCGGCRQVIWEFGMEARLILANTEGHSHVCTIAELLPRAFRAHGETP